MLSSSLPTPLGFLDKDRKEFTRDSDGPSVYLVLQLKKEGIRFCGVLLEDLLSLLKWYSELCLRSNLSVVLLSVLGNRLEVSTIIFTETTYRDRFLSIGPHLGPNGPDNSLHVVCVPSDKHPYRKTPQTA